MACGDARASSVAQEPVASRADNYDEALARAKATDSDIVVFQRGSDWNRLGETLYSNVWMTDELLRELGPGFILVAVDHPEAAGGRAVLGQCSAVHCGITGFSDLQIGSSAPLRLAKLVDDKSPLPREEIVAIGSKEQVPYRTRSDSTWVAQPNTNPAHDVLALRLRSGNGGNVVRLDFPTDPSLPGGGPGRASNGNFGISQVDAQLGERPIKLTAAWASAAEGNWGAWQAIDGIGDHPDNCWNPAANLHLRRTLLLVLGEKLPPEVPLTIRLTCQTQWDQHVPGAIRGAVLSRDTLAADIAAVYKAQLNLAENAKFTWWDTAYCPRVALLDSRGRAVSCENKPRLDLTPSSLADRIKQLRSVREQRDALWAKAEATQGPEKAELLRQSLDLLGIANWAGNDNCYQFIHDEMTAADPQDESGAIRWLGFPALARDGAPGMEAADKALNEKRYEDALAEVDEQLADPRNKALDHDRIQRIMLHKDLIYRSWPGHEEQRFEVQRQIAALDSTTYLGIGAVGYAGMYHRSPTPMLPYGWGPAQIKAGQNTWDITNTDYYFDHPGTYKLTLACTGGKDSLTVHRIAMFDGNVTVAEASPLAPANEVGPGHAVEVILNLKSWTSNRKYTLRIESEAAQAALDNTGNFGIEPQFDPPGTKPSLQLSSAISDEVTQTLASGDIAAWQKHLGDLVLSQGADNALATPGVRAALAQEELIRECHADKIAAIAKRENGNVFLARFMSDTDWLESFLDSGPSDRAQALENLRFLYEYAADDFANPIVKRMATAMSLNVGENFSRYRLFDRFKHTQWALQQGLLHADFETYTVREMRFAVYMPGTARDYQFLLDDRQNTVGDYFGACWAIAYRDSNDYGFSVQGWGYTDPWQWFYGSGEGARPLKAQRQIGGVCGTLSEYGASAAQAHGVMSVTVGQPGHCAYVIRVGDSWGIGNDVFGPASTGFAAWNWDGTGYSVAADLWEPVEADREHFMNATRLAWLARLQIDRSADKSAGLWTETYQHAIDTQPLNYGTWLEYVTAITAAQNVPPATLLALGRRAAEVFAPYHQPAFALAHRCFEKAAPSMKATDRMAYLLELQRLLRQDKATHLAAYNWSDNFQWEADHLGDPAMELPFFAALLQIHHSPDPQYNGLFGGVISWGSSRFSALPATSVAYAKRIQGFFQSLKSPADTAVLSDAISNGIRKSSETSDRAGYRAWSDMATRMLPPVKPEDVYLNAAQAAAAPQILPFHGDLLSKTGMLQTSSACQYDRPLSYAQILKGGIGGWFDTNSEENPWAQVQLSGESVLSGILLVNRYEFDPNSEEFRWAVPLRVSVSIDGKTWTEVASITQADAVFRVDLRSKAPRARYVRIERIASADKTAPPGRFHFRNFLIYGRALPAS